MSSDLYQIYLFMLKGHGAKVLNIYRGKGYHAVEIEYDHDVHRFKLLDNDIYLKEDGNIRYQSLHWSEWEHNV